MESLNSALARLQIGPSPEEVNRLTDMLSRLHIEPRLECPICGKMGVFWSVPEHGDRIFGAIRSGPDRKGKHCMAKRDEAYQQINQGHQAMKKILASEAIAKSRK